MQIRHVSIRNFRGIRELDWAVPPKQFLCLIGCGDSTKSTILEAIRRAFHPQWNLAFDDSDFFRCKPENTITIEVVLGQIPDVFRDLERFGHQLCGWNATESQCHAEPGEGLEDVVCVRLTVGADLEPNWQIVRHGQLEGQRFGPADREKVGVSLIGPASDRHLTWARGSLLAGLGEATSLSLSLAETARAARSAFDARREQSLAAFDTAARKAEATARDLGVRVESGYKAHLDAESLSLNRGGLALHDGDMPLRRLGLGSKRILTTGIHNQGLTEPHVTLVDEVEIGLEPHRISRLTKHLKTDRAGQYFVTTHSPVVLRELGIDDLHVVHCRAGSTEIVAANKAPLAELIQGKIRRGAEAFLAPKIVVCEGATEAGFLRGLDDLWVGKGMSSFAYQGIAVFDAGGANKVCGVANSLVQLAYKVAVLADSDSPDQLSTTDLEALILGGVEVVVWAGGVSIEERAFLDLPWEGVLATYNAACAMHGPTCLDQVQTQHGTGFLRDAEKWADNQQLRRYLGRAAKNGDWFKRQDRAQEWAGVAGVYIDTPTTQETDFVRKLRALRTWIDNA